MKALAKNEKTTGIALIDTPKPTIGQNDVLIKIRKASICGTDLHIYNWDDWAKENIPVPLVIGHEFIGEVIEVGADVKDYKIGDRVTGENHIACGHCRNCRAGRAHVCRKNLSVGVNLPGCLAEYLALPAVNAYPVPDNISDDIAAILNPLGNAVHTALSFDLVGEDVLITGAGPVGILAAKIAMHVGARKVAITDINPYRLALAKKLGISNVFDAKTHSLDQVMSILDLKEGFDVGLEMSGNNQAFNSMIHAMNHAGKIAMLGFQPKDSGIDWNEVIMKGLTIKGIYGREMYETWYKMIAMLQSGLDISAIITHYYDYKDFEAAFKQMNSGEAGKVILNW